MTVFCIGWRITMSDIFSFLLTLLINEEVVRVAVDIRSGYIEPDSVRFYYREPETETKIKALIPLHIFDPSNDKGFQVIEVTRISTVVSINQTKDLQEGK